MENRKRISFEDDLVVVHQNGAKVYSGLEDYEPMKNAEWVWNEQKKQYEFKDFVKVCIGG